MLLPSSLLTVFLAAPVEAAEYRHVVVIIADDLGSDKVSAYAGDVANPSETRPSTPNIDLLADAGVRFTDAWAMPVCSPSRAALYSGQFAYRNGVGDAVATSASPSLSEEAVTIQQLAEQEGMETALFGKWHVGVLSDTPRSASTAASDRAEYPIRTGFGTFRGSTGGEPRSYEEWLYVESLADSSMSSGYSTMASDELASVTDETTVSALEWLTDQDSVGNRAFAVVSYNLPHSTSNGGRSGTSWADAVTACGGTPSGDDATDYDFAVECLDDAIAELLAGLPDPDATLVVFMGDNGTPRQVSEGSFDDGRGKGSVFESGARIPLIFADGAALADAIEAGGAVPTDVDYTIDVGGSSGALVNVVDLYATLVDLLGLDTGGYEVGTDIGQDSISVAEILVGGEGSRTANWTEKFSTSASTGATTGSGAVRVGDYKLVANTGFNSCRSYSVYDLSTDRFEATDIYETVDADILAELMSALEERADAMAGSSSDWLAFDDCCESRELWYDGRDSDCDGASDYDQDGDGIDALEHGGSDCDDINAEVNPSVVDYPYDGLDADCDGANDFDLDGDGFPSADFGGADCDDLLSSVWPGAPDVLYDGTDADCGGDSDYDGDRDGYDDAAFSGTDCDDSTPTVNPGRNDPFYDGVDSDCSGGSDHDADHDGFDAIAYGGTDCNDRLWRVKPGANDSLADGVDADCDGAAD